MEVILDDLASKSRVLYEEGKFKEVEEMFNTFIKESGQFKASPTIEGIVTDKVARMLMQS